MQNNGTIILLSHCLLNANSKIRGGARYGPVFKPVIECLLQHEVGVVQLPCPEHSFCGSARWGQSKDQYDNPFFRNHCRRILQPILEQLCDYAAQGYVLPAVLGIKGSPSCGVEHTFRAGWGGELGTNRTALPQGYLASEAGVFMEVFRQMLQEAGLKLKFIEVDEEDPSIALDKLKELLA